MIIGGPDLQIAFPALVEALTITSSPGSATLSYHTLFSTQRRGLENRTCVYAPPQNRV